MKKSTSKPKKAPSPKLKSYSVLLLYPDYISAWYGETYYGWVQAKDRDHAVYLARRKCAKTNDLLLDENNEDDFAEVLVLEGHHEGI